jgi:hypothetical protein
VIAADLNDAGWRAGRKWGTSMPGAANERQGQDELAFDGQKNRKIIQPTNLELPH